MPEWAFLMLFLGLLFAYKAIIGLQGFDMCDEGWLLSAYQQIFNDPTTCAYHFLYYNALPVGGLWNMIFGSWGIYGFRILAAISSVTIAYVVYLLLRHDVNRWSIFIGIWLFNLGYVMVFHHNWVTALLVTLAALFLYKGLKASNGWWVLLAGVVVGINIFTRIPNVSMLTLSLAFVPYYLYTKDVRSTLLLLGMAIVGVIVGIVCELAIMHTLGHLSIFIDNLSSGFSAASASDSSHSLSRVFSIYFGNYLKVFTTLMLVLSYPVFIYFVDKYVENKKHRQIALYVSALLYVILIWSSIDHVVYAIYGLSYFIYGIYIYKHTQDKNRVYLITIASIILFFLPFGSDYGIGNMGVNCIWIAAPLTIQLLYDLLQEHKETIAYNDIRRLVYICLFAFVSMTLYETSLYCYFDSGSRLKKTTRPSTVALATTYTTHLKSAQVDTLMVHLKPLVNKDDYLLCYQHVPMVNYLTETRPYLGTSWPWVYDAANLERQFEKAQETISILPVILRNKSEIASWTHYSKDWDEDDDRKIKLIHNFIETYNYTVYWENALFQILVPQGKPRLDEGTTK